MSDNYFLVMVNVYNRANDALWAEYVGNFLGKEEAITQGKAHELRIMNEIMDDWKSDEYTINKEFKFEHQVFQIGRFQNENL